MAARLEDDVCLRSEGIDVRGLCENSVHVEYSAPAGKRLLCTPSHLQDIGSAALLRIDVTGEAS